MNRQLPALVAAFLITLFVALVMSVVGVDAMLNQNGVDVSNSASAAPVPAAVSGGTGQENVQQLQTLVGQYQQREAQYRQLLQRDQQQLQQDSLQIQNYQQLLFALQDQGLIRIDSDGRVRITGEPGE